MPGLCRQSRQAQTHLRYIHRLALNAATYDEGDTVTATYSLDRRGYTPTSQDIAEVIKFRVPAAATAHENEFSTPLGAALLAAEMTGAVYSFTGEHVFTLDYTFVGPLVITWKTVDDGVAEGDQVLGLEIYGNSSGSLSGAIQTAALIDTGLVQAPQVAISVSTHDAGLATGTLVGLLSVENGTGTYTFSLTDDDGDRYAIDGVDTHRLEIGTTAAVAGSYAIAGEADNGVDDPILFNFLITALPIAQDEELFADTFNRANENLEASVDWDLQAGTASKVTINSNEVRMLSGTDTFVTAPALDTINHYAEGPLASIGSKVGFIDVAVVDASNLIAVRYVTTPASAFEVWARVAGNWGTAKVSLAASPSIGDMFRVEMREGVVTVKVAGVDIGGYTLTSTEADIFDNGVKVGVNNSTGSGQFLQSFAAGALGPLVPPAPLQVFTGNQVTEGSAQGTLISTISIQNGTGNYTHSITAGNGGNQFQISGNDIEAGPNPTDFETASSHLLTISSSNGVDSPTIGQVTLNVLDVAESPLEQQPLDPNAFYLRVDSVAGTVVGALTLPGQTVTDRTITSQSTFRSFNAPYSPAIFAISGTNLIVASGNTATFVGGQFNGSDGTLYSAFGLPWYEVVVSYTVAGSGTPVVKTYRIRPRYNHIAPTGDATNNVYTVNTLSVNAAINETTKTGGLRALLLFSQGNRTIVIDPSVIGTHEINSNSYTDLITGNLTVTGHRRSIQFRDFCLRVFGATNVIMRDMAFRVGGDTVGSEISNDRDSLQLTSGQNILIENSDISWAYDESTSAGWNNWQPAISPKPTMKDLRFKRNFWYSSGEAPCHNESGEEVSHPYGVLINDYCANIVGHKNVLMGFRQRSPISYRNYGSLWQNNALIYGTNSGAAWTQHESSGSKPRSTYIHRNNLMRPAFQTAIARSFAYASWRSILGDIEVKEYGNHFIGDVNTGDYSSFNFAADPIIPSSHFKANSGANSGIFVSHMPFLPATEMDADLMPTDTAQQREDLFWDIVNYAGCRARNGSGDLLPGVSNMSKIGAWYMSNFLTGTNVTLTPTGTNKYNNPPTNTRCGTENTGTGTVIPIKSSAGGIARPNFPNDLVSAGFANGGYDTGLPV